VTKGYKEIVELIRSKKFTLSAKTFDGRTEFATAIAHSSTPGKSEKTVIVF
jgi:hypothetical protein